MENIEPNKKTNQWILFVAVMLMLFGIYGALRTIINMVAFEKYPQEGVYPNLPILGGTGGGGYGPYYGGREEDCTAYPMVYYMKDGYTTRKATDDEKAQEKKQQENCISQVTESRNKAKINDISQSVLFLFLGAGVFAFRRIFK